MFHPSYPSPTFTPWRYPSPDEANFRPPPNVAWVEDPHAPCPASPRWVTPENDPSSTSNCTANENAVNFSVAWSDDDAPCPPTPQPEWIEHQSASAVYQSNTEPRCYSPSPRSRVEIDLNDWPKYDDLAVVNSINRARYDRVTLSEIRHASDCLIYARNEYAFPSPILIMIRRTVDRNHLHTQPSVLISFDEPFKLFSLTGGHIPLTGLTDVDHESRLYYSKRPNQPPHELVEIKYPVSAIKQVQRSLLVDSCSVYPAPIPAIIIRSDDIVGPYDLRRRSDGHAFVVPAEDSLWSIICHRGVDMNYRPLDSLATVETSLCKKGEALYHAQHIVASKFAVNIFLELPDHATGLNSRCEYMGAYVIRVMDGLTINHATWMNINPVIRQSVYDRVPGSHDRLSLDWPRLPYVQFCFYKWDENMVALADEAYVCQARTTLLPSIPTAEVETTESYEPAESLDPCFASNSESNCSCDDRTGYEENASFPSPCTSTS